jgi:hypothetical protein
MEKNQRLATEICKNCGEVIGALEQAFLYGSQPVCARCNKRLNGNEQSPIRWAIGGAAAMGAVAAIVLMIFIYFTGRHPNQTTILEQPSPSRPAAAPSAQQAVDAPVSREPQAAVQEAPLSPLQSQPQPITQAPVVFGTVMGSAWVSKEDGTSDLQRGLAISVLRTRVGRPAVAKSLDVIAAGWQSDIDDNLAQAAEYRKNETGLSDYDPGKIWDDAADDDKRGLAAVKAAAQNLPDELDLKDAMALDKNLAQFNIPQFGPIVSECSIRDARTDADGKYRFDDVPIGDYYVHAAIDTKAFYIEWIVPVHVDGKSIDKVDIYNDNAVVVHNTPAN